MGLLPPSLSDPAPNAMGEVKGQSHTAWMRYLGSRVGWGLRILSPWEKGRGGSDPSWHPRLCRGFLPHNCLQSRVISQE